MPGITFPINQETFLDVLQQKKHTLPLETVNGATDAVSALAAFGGLPQNDTELWAIHAQHKSELNLKVRTRQAAILAAVEYNGYPEDTARNLIATLEEAFALACAADTWPVHLEWEAVPF